MRIIYLKYILLTSFFFITVACGGGGGGDGGTAPASTATSNRLFVMDSFSNALASISNANPAQGILTLDTTIDGASAQFRNVDDIALDITNNRIYLANGTSILVFDNASTATGNIAPTRMITSASFGNVSQLFLDTTNNLLYVGDDLKGIWVIGNASSANGNVVPARSITGNFGGTSFVVYGVAVDLAKDILYVSIRTSSPYEQKIIVFNSASTVNGNTLVASRSFSTTGNPGQLVLDEANDRLYMADSGGYGVKVYDNASTLNDAVTSVTPSREIKLGASITDIKVDFSNDRLYALNPSLMYIVQNASSADGFVVATQLQAANITTILDAIAVAP